MTKAQIKFKLINSKSAENEKEFLLMTDDLKTSKEFVLGSSGDVKVEGVAAKAAIIGYNADLKCWYIQGVDKNKGVYQSLATMYQLSKACNIIII